MSANKKPTTEEDFDDSETESSDDDDMCSEEDDELQIDFEGRAPIDPDSDGISQLLSRLFLKAPVNYKEMATLIISQNYVGSVLYQCEPDGVETDDDMCEEDTVFGVTTVLNITAKKDIPCIEQLRSYLTQQAQKHAADAVKSQFQQILDNKTQHVGFLVNERFINIPAKVFPSMLKALQGEIEVATTKGMPFKFAYILMIVKFFREDSKDSTKNTEDIGDDMYTNEEEEYICKKAIASFEYSVETECDTGISGKWLKNAPMLTPYRRVVLLDAKEFSSMLPSIQEYLNESYTIVKD